mgnify:CR=1 FL=1
MFELGDSLVVGCKVYYLVGKFSSLVESLVVVPKSSSWVEV